MSVNIYVISDNRGPIHCNTTGAWITLVVCRVKFESARKSENQYNAIGNTIKVETRLRTSLEFTFAHIYHLRTKKYDAYAHLEINVCAHFLFNLNLFHLWQYLQYWKVSSPNKWMSDSLRNQRFVSVENITIFVSLVLMYIIFSSWLENASYWSRASHISSLDFGNFGLLYMACLTDLTSPDNKTVVSCFAISVIIILFGLSLGSSEALRLHSWRSLCLWIDLSSGSEWLCSNRPSNTIKSLRSVVHVALHYFLVHRHVLDDFASLNSMDSILKSIR